MALSTTPYVALYAADTSRRSPARSAGAHVYLSTKYSLAVIFGPLPSAVATVAASASSWRTSLSSPAARMRLARAVLTSRLIA
eukprot:7384786-Prymnesium_polylepis.3